MDNQVFNINGTERKMLRKALELALMVDKYYKPKAWKIDNKKGLILFWSVEKDTTPFDKPLNLTELTKFVWDFLHSQEAFEVELEDWDRDIDDDPCGFDGSVKYGWRVYKERWGRVLKSDSEYETYEYSFLGITPCYAWYGK